MNDAQWQEPVSGFEFTPEEVVVSEAFQSAKLAACGLDSGSLDGFVDAAFFIAIGIRAGINNGISAEGNVNMLTRLVQHRRVRLGEPLIARGFISKVTAVPRGQRIETEVWFEDQDGRRAISAPRTSLRPARQTGSESATNQSAGERPAPVIDNVDELTRFGAYSLTPQQVKDYSLEGNSIHYELAAANKAGFRAPIIGGGMGVHYLIHTLYEQQSCQSFDLSVYFRRPIFWDDEFVVAADPWRAIALLRAGKVLTEAKINAVN
ncbi:hypothetical protein OAD22_04630 [Pseudomonadales bacterium]|nr:hypothetical protein [Pseudomonadales bacterium]MDB9917041.1 hypothetical protein [Pseudomonadales bacterium]